MLKMAELNMESSKRDEIIEIIHKLKSMDEALKDCNSQDIFKAIAISSSNIIYEMLQNADDAGASKVEFNIYDDKIFITNNGNKFEKKDILKLCAVSQEKESQSMIGRFGVGFKSIYTLAKQVDLFSNGYFIKINDFINVQILDEGYKEFCDEDTHFVLHLYKDDCEYQSITGQNYRERKNLNGIIDEIRKFEHVNFILLNNVNSIEINYNNENLFSYKREILKTVRIHNNFIENFEEIIVNHRDHYISFSSFYEKNNNDNRYLKVLYKLNEEKNIVPLFNNGETTCLYSFFPLKAVNTNLNFIIQGRFLTDITRTSLDFSKEINKTILNGLIKVIGESVVTIIKMGYKLNYNLFPLVRNLRSNNEIIELIYNKVVDEFISIFSYEPVLLGVDGNYYKANQILKIKEENSSKPYNYKDNSLRTNRKKVKILFDTKEIYNESDTLYWIDNQLEDILDKYNEKNYELKILESMGIRQLTLSDVVSFLSNYKNNLQNKSNDWLISFYVYIFSDKELLDQCKYLELFKTERLRFSSILHKNTESNTTKYNLYLEMSEHIDKDLVELDAIEFFNKELLKSVQLYDCIKNTGQMIVYSAIEIITGILKDFNENFTGNRVMYYKTLSEVIGFIKIEKVEFRKKVYEYLKVNLPISNCRSLNNYLISEDGKYYYYRGISNFSNTCFHWDDEDYFKLYEGKKATKEQLMARSVNNSSDYQEHCFLDSIIYKENLNEDDYNFWISILPELDIKPGILQYDKFRSHKSYDFKLEENQNVYKNRIRPDNSSNYVDFFCPSILYITIILENITEDNSKKLWNIILELFRELNFNSEGYITNHYAQQVEKFKIKSELIHLLRGEKWIYNENSQVNDPLNLRYKDLEENGYIAPTDKSVRENKKLCNLLGISVDKESSNRMTNIEAEVKKLNSDEMIKLFNILNEQMNK